MALWSTELPAQNTQLRQVVSLSLSLSTLRASRQLEASGAHCHRHARLHRLNTGQGARKPGNLDFFQPADLETRKCKGSHRKLLMNAIVKDTSKHTKTLDIFNPDYRSDSNLSHCS